MSDPIFDVGSLRMSPDLVPPFVVSVTIDKDHRHEGRHDVKYMLLLASNPADEPTPDSEAFGPYMDEWAAYSQALAEAGAMVAGEALDWAARIPNSHFGTIEVRPVMEFDG